LGEHPGQTLLIEPSFEKLIVREAQQKASPGEVVVAMVDDEVRR